MYAKVRILTHKVSTVFQTLDFILQIPKLLSTKKIGMQKNNPLLETVFQSFGMRFQMQKVNDTLWICYYLNTKRRKLSFLNGR